MSSLKLNKFDWIALTMLSIVALAAGWLFRSYQQDDAYITYRYSRNLANGIGFVYTAGENVLGTSTPFYALTLAGLTRVTNLEVTTVSHVFGTLCLVSCGWLIFGLGKEWNRWGAFLASILFITNPLLLMSFGMEGFLMVLLLLVVVLLWRTRHLGWAGLFGGLLVITRFETGLFLVLLVVVELRRSRKFPYKLLLGLIPILGWLIYSQITFGFILPQSVQSKLLAPRIPFWLGGIYWIYFYIKELPGLILMLPLAMAGLATIREMTLEWKLLIGWSLLYLVSSLISAGSFPWYYAGLIPALSFLTAGGAVVIWSWSERLLNGTNLEGYLRASHSIIIGTLMLCIIGLQILGWFRQSIPVNGVLIEPRTLDYQPIANWLISHAHPGDKVTAEEIGYLGWETNLEMIDLYALVTPQLTSYLQSPLTDRLQQAVTIFQPQFVVVGQGSSLDQMMQHQKGYTLVNLHDSTTGHNIYQIGKINP